MTTLHQGIQLYTLREQIQNFEDADKTFAAIRDFGCSVIQISGIGPIEPEKVQELVERYQFEVCVTHKPMDRMLHDLDALIEEHKMIGCDMIGIGYMPNEYHDDPEKVLEFARLAEQIGENMAKKGMRLAYHNHDFEFKTLANGKNAMDILLENTDSEYVKIVPDVAWVQYAGFDPCDFLRRIHNRVKVVHIKDYRLEADGQKKFTEFGTGLVDFSKVYKTIKSLGIPYAVYEQDSDWRVSPLESCKYSFAQMLRTAESID